MNTQQYAQAPIRKQNKKEELTATACSLEEYQVAFSRKGGKAGRGACKRRSPEHYKKMVEARWGKRTE